MKTGEVQQSGALTCEAASGALVGDQLPVIRTDRQRVQELESLGHRPEGIVSKEHDPVNADLGEQVREGRLVVEIGERAGQARAASLAS
jgi:hypothetical protein